MLFIVPIYCNAYVIALENVFDSVKNNYLLKYIAMNCGSIKENAADTFATSKCIGSIDWLILYSGRYGRCQQQVC